MFVCTCVHGWAVCVKERVREIWKYVNVCSKSAYAYAVVYVHCVCVCMYANSIASNEGITI